PPALPGCFLSRAISAAAHAPAEPMLTCQPMPYLSVTAPKMSPPELLLQVAAAGDAGLTAEDLLVESDRLLGVTGEEKVAIELGCHDRLAFHDFDGRISAITPCMLALRAPWSCWCRSWLRG